jgi:hypothetical protein
MRYKVTRQYDKGIESHFAQLSDLHDAKLFVNAKLAEDAALNLKVIYRILEFTEMVMEFDPTKQNASTTATQGSQGQSNQANFRPSPLSTTARPPGMPQNWREDDDE